MLTTETNPFTHTYTHAHAEPQGDWLVAAVDSEPTGERRRHRLLCTPRPPQPAARKDQDPISHCPNLAMYLQAASGDTGKVHEMYKGLQFIFILV